MSTIPAPVMMELGLAMLEGALKYGRHNFRVIGVRASVYYDALQRHIQAFWEGQDIDPESGISHLVKAISCLVVLRDAQMRGNWVDDRPPPTPDGWVEELNRIAAALVEKYPNAVPPYTHVGNPTNLEGVTHEADETSACRDRRTPRRAAGAGQRRAARTGADPERGATLQSDQRASGSAAVRRGAGASHRAASVSRGHEAAGRRAAVPRRRAESGRNAGADRRRAAHDADG